jgi:hypothetical protein
VIANIDSPGGQSSLAARLLDVSPAGTETLVARGLLRPGPGGTDFVFQLHPQAYRFAPGSVAKLELLPSDAPYSRPSNAQSPITVSNLELRLPVLEQPGSLGGIVQEPAPPVVPPGYRLVPGYPTAGPADGQKPTVAPGVAGLAKGKIRATGKALRLRLRCTGATNCTGRLKISVTPKRKGKPRRTLVSGAYSLTANRTSRLTLRLTKAGRRVVAAHANRRPGRVTFPARLDFSDSGRPALFQLTRPVHTSEAG